MQPDLPHRQPTPGWQVQQAQAYPYPPGHAPPTYAQASAPGPAWEPASALPPNGPYGQYAQQGHLHQPPQAYYAAPQGQQPAQSTGPTGPGGSGGGGAVPEYVQQGTRMQDVQGGPQVAQNGYHHQPGQQFDPAHNSYPAPPPPPQQQAHRPPSRPPSTIPPQQQQQHPQLMQAPSAAYGTAYVQASLQSLQPSSAALMSPTAHRFNSNPSPAPPTQMYSAQHPPQPSPQQHSHHAPAPPGPQPQAPIPTVAGLDAHIARLDEAAQVQHHVSQLETVLKRGAYPAGGPRAGQPLTPDQRAQMERQVHELRNRELSVLTTCDTFTRAHGGTAVVNRFVEQYRASVQRQQHMHHAAMQSQAQGHAQAQERRAAVMQGQGYPPSQEAAPPRPASEAPPHAQLQHIPPHQRMHSYPQQQTAPQVQAPSYAPHPPSVATLQGQPQYQPSPSRQAPQIQRRPSAAALPQQYAMQQQGPSQSQAHPGYPPAQPAAAHSAPPPHPHHGVAQAQPNGAGAQDRSAGMHAQQMPGNSREHAQRQLAASRANMAQGQPPQGQAGYEARAAWDEAEQRDREEHERREREKAEQAKARAAAKHPTQVLAEGAVGWPSLADLQAQTPAPTFWDMLRQVTNKRGQQLSPQGYYLENRPIDLFRLSQVVIGQFHGYVRSDFDKSWMHIASQFGYAPSSSAPGQLRELYMRVLAPYEDHWSSQEVKKLRLNGAQQMLAANGAQVLQPDHDAGMTYTSAPPRPASTIAQHLPFVPSASGVGLVHHAGTTQAPLSLALPPQPTYALPQHPAPPEHSLSSMFANSFASFPLAPSPRTTTSAPSAAPVVAMTTEPTVQELVAQAKELKREHLADKAAAEAVVNSAVPGAGSSSEADFAQVAPSPQTSSTPKEQFVPDPFGPPPTPRTTAAHAANAAGQVAPSSAPQNFLRSTPSGSAYLSPGAASSPPLSRTGSSSRKRERTREPDDAGEVEVDAGRRKREGTGTFADVASTGKAPHHLVVPLAASPVAIETPDLVASRALRPDSATSTSTSTSVSPRSVRALSLSAGSLATPTTPGASAAPQPLTEVATPVHAALAVSASALSLGTSDAVLANGDGDAEDPLAKLSLTTPVTAGGLEASPALFGGTGWGDPALPSYGALDGSSALGGGFDFASDANDLFAGFAGGGTTAPGAGKTPALGALEDEGWPSSGLLDFEFAADFSSHS